MKRSALSVPEVLLAVTRRCSGRGLLLAPVLRERWLRGARGNFPSTNQSNASTLEFEVTLDEAIEPGSASPAKTATAVLVIIPRGIKFKVDMESHPGATCVRIPVGEST